MAEITKRDRNSEMVQLRIELTDEEDKALSERAEMLGVDKKNLVQMAVRDFVRKLQDENYFDSIIEKVVKKNAELYKKLA
jgi:hypothetical protein